MPEFTVGDQVKVIYHPKERYIGLEGQISSVGESFGSATQPVPESGRIPDLSMESRYTLELSSGDYLHDLRKEWLELLPI